MSLRSRIDLRYLLVFAATVLVGAAARGADPPSYPMVCKGGGPMQLVQSPRSSTTDRIYVEFQRAESAAGAATVPPGRCTWLDRSMTADEPARLMLAASNIGLIIRMSGDGRVHEVTAIDLGGGAAARDRFQYLANGVLRGETFYVHARRSGDVLVVSRTGP